MAARRDDAAFGQRQLAVPDKVEVTRDMPEAAPDNLHAIRQRRARVDGVREDHAGAIPPRRRAARSESGAEHFGRLDAGGPDDATANRGRFGRTELLPHRPAVARRVQQDALAGGGVTAAGAQGLKDGLAREFPGKHTRKAAVDAEDVRAWVRGAGTALMVVARAHKAQAHAAAQRVVEEPLEQPPAGVYLDETLEVLVVEIQAGVPAADVGDDEDVVASGKGPVEFGDGIAVAGGVAFRKICVTGAADGLVVLEIDDVVVAAAGGVARPFGTEEGRETARLVVLAHGVLNLPPAVVANVEIVALVGGKGDTGDVAGIAEIVVRRADAEGLDGLAVQVAPKALQRGAFGHEQGIGDAFKTLPLVNDAQPPDAGALGRRQFAMNHSAAGLGKGELHGRAEFRLPGNPHL